MNKAFDHEWCDHAEGYCGKPQRCHCAILSEEPGDLSCSQCAPVERNDG